MDELVLLIVKAALGAPATAATVIKSTYAGLRRATQGALGRSEQIAPAVCRGRMAQSQVEVSIEPLDGEFDRRTFDHQVITFRRGRGTLGAAVRAANAFGRGGGVLFRASDIEMLVTAEDVQGLVERYLIATPCSMAGFPPTPDEVGKGIAYVVEIWEGTKLVTVEAPGGSH